jgi:hypothetical protein
MSIDPSFLRGFRSLPDELKLMVPKHAVRTDIAIVSYLFLDERQSLPYSLFQSWEALSSMLFMARIWC